MFIFQQVGLKNFAKARNDRFFKHNPHLLLAASPHDLFPTGLSQIQKREKFTDIVGLVQDN